MYASRCSDTTFKTSSKALTFGLNGVRLLVHALSLSVCLSVCYGCCCSSFSNSDFVTLQIPAKRKEWSSLVT